MKILKVNMKSVHSIAINDTLQNTELLSLRNEKNGNKMDNI